MSARRNGRSTHRTGTCPVCGRPNLRLRWAAYSAMPGAKPYAIPPHHDEGIRVRCEGSGWVLAAHETETTLD